jgi:hypothetical protein
MQSITIITNIVSSNITLCDKVCHLHATGRWLSPGTQVSSSNKTDGYDITETLLTVVLNTITPNPRILDIMKLEQIHLMVVKNRKLCLRKKL